MHRHAQRLTLALLFVAGVAGAQTVPLPLAVNVANLPTCNATRDAQVYGVRDADTPVVGDVVVGGGTENVVVQCDNAAAGIKWVVKATDSGGGGGASTFDELGSGTNTTATMTVGTGASMLTSGSGTIAATSASDLTCTDCINDTEISTNAGTALSADLEEETHATEHSLGGTDAVTVTNLASACTDAQVTGGTAAGTGVECQTDDDVPESGDFGAGVDLEADGSLSADVVAAAEMADADHGDVTWSGGVASVEDDSHNHGAGTIAGLDAGDTTTGTFADARVDGSAEADELVLAGDVDGAANANDLDEAAVETELEAVLDLDQLQGQIADAQIAAGAVDGGNLGEIADGSVTADDLGTDSVSADELNATGVESELEAVLEVGQLQGGLAADQVDTITDIAAALKSGADGELITGTIATTNAVVTVDANDDLVELGAPLTYNITAATCTGDGNGGALTVNVSNEIVCSADDGGAGGGMPAREYYWTASSLLPAAPADNIPPIALAQGTNADILYAGFDASADECRSNTLKVPADIDTSGTLTFRVVWDSVDQTSGAVVWDIRHITRTEGEAWDAALTTESAASDTTQGTAGLITITTWTETVSNAGWAAGDEVYFLVCRDGDGTAGTDDMAGDARMHSFAVLIPQA